MSVNPTAVLQKQNTRLQQENEQLREEVRDLREFVQSLNGLMQAGDRVQSDSELKSLLRNILSRALNLLNTPDGSLVLVDEDQNELVFVLVHGTLGEDLEGFRIPIDEGIAGWVVKKGQAVMVRDVRHDSRFSHMVDDAFKFRTQSIAAAPLIGNRRIYGVIEALNQPGDEPFSDNDLALLGLLCRVAGAVLAELDQQWLDE